MSAIPRWVAIEVRARADGKCEACDHYMDPDEGKLHHRKLRSGGGPHTVANLMLVHAVCHNMHTNSIHSRIDRSRRLGHILRTTEDPELIWFVPVYNLLALTA